MSEEQWRLLDGQLNRTRWVASWAITLALMALSMVVIAFIVNWNQAESIRDLQRRVGQLEQQR